MRRTRPKWASRLSIRHSPPRTLKGIVLTGASPEESWGSQWWRNAFRTVPPAPIYADAAYTAAKAERDAVDTAITAREDSVYGRIIRYFDGSAFMIETMAWGSDRFLGAGSMKGYTPLVPFYVAPTNLVSEAQSFSLDGSIPIQLLPASDGSAGLMAWLPDQKILIAGDSGRYLPDAGSIRQAGASIPERIKVLDQMLGLAPTNFVPAHGLHISGAGEKCYAR